MIIIFNAHGLNVRMYITPDETRNRNVKVEISLSRNILRNPKVFAFWRKQKERGIWRYE